MTRCRASRLHLGPRCRMIVSGQCCGQMERLSNLIQHVQPGSTKATFSAPSRPTSCSARSPQALTTQRARSPCGAAPTERPYFRLHALTTRLGPDARVSCAPHAPPPVSPLTAPSAAQGGRAAVAALFSQLAGRAVRVVSGGGGHQFGNTGSGVAASGDTRTLHIVNANTVAAPLTARAHPSRALSRGTSQVAALSAAAGVPLHPERFRPNVVLAGSLPAWAEFGWVSRSVRLGGATLAVVKRTVRCEGVDVDARYGSGRADVSIPALLAKHFPEHGPYLGVYAQESRAHPPRRPRRGSRAQARGIHSL